MAELEDDPVRYELATKNASEQEALAGQAGNSYFLNMAEAKQSWAEFENFRKNLIPYVQSLEFQRRKNIKEGLEQFISSQKQIVDAMSQGFSSMSQKISELALAEISDSLRECL